MKLKLIAATAALLISTAATAHAALAPWEFATIQEAAQRGRYDCPATFSQQYVVQNKTTGGWMKVFSNKTTAGALLNGEPKDGVTIGQVLTDPAFSSVIAGNTPTQWTPYCVNDFASTVNLGDAGPVSLSVAGVAGAIIWMIP